MIAALSPVVVVALPPLARADVPECQPVTLDATTATKGPLPIDARILARPHGCWGTPETSAVELRKRTETAAVAIDASFVVTSSTGDWYALKPRADLAPETAYTLTLHAQGGATASLEFTTAKERTVTTTNVPKVVVTSAEYNPRVNGAGDVQATYQLTLSMPEGGPGGAFYLNGRKLVTGVTPVANGTPLPRFSSDALVPVTEAEPVATTASRLIRAGAEACFTVTYEDAAGHMSAESASSCFAAVRGPDDPPVPEQDGASPSSTQEKASGCATATARPGPAGLAYGCFAALALALLATRRRRRAGTAPVAAELVAGDFVS